MKESWDDCDTWTKALILAYHQTAEHDEAEAIAASIPKTPRAPQGKRGRR